MNEIQLFNNPEFGEIRSIQIDNEPWFVGKDIADILGYQNGSRDIQRHVDDEDKLTHRISASGQMRDVILINESGVYALIFGSKLDKAKAFKHWVTSEVLPQIRQTGQYVPQIAEPSRYELRMIDIQDRESRTQNANLLLSIADRLTAQSETCKQTLYAHAANIAVGSQIIQPPKCEQKTYTATEIANILGVTPNRIGIIANEHDMKHDEYGEMFYAMDKVGTPRQSFRYNEKALALFQQLVSEWRATAKKKSK